MNKDNKKYFLVGSFILSTSLILILFWLWFLSSDRQSYNIFMTVFTEPIDGISTNSVVKYNGVEIGKVKAIDLDHSDPHNIIVYLNILQKVPINIDTFASIKPLGITGLSFIDMHLPKDSDNTKNIVPHNKPPYPVIRTESSFLTTISDQAQLFTNNIKDISVQLKILLNQKNLQHIDHILNNMDQITTNVANHNKDISNSINSVSEILLNLKKTAKGFDNTIMNIDVITNKLVTTTDNTNNLILAIKENTLNNFNTVLLPNLNQAIEHMDDSSYQLAQLLSLLNHNPSVLIRGIAKQKVDFKEKSHEE